MASAIIETGGKQYRVEPGQIIAIELLGIAAGETVNFDRVLMVSDGSSVTLGAPTVAGYAVTGEVLEEEAKGKKIRVFTYKSKKRQRRTIGHRQRSTMVKITGIAEAKPKAAKS